MKRSESDSPGKEDLTQFKVILVFLLASGIGIGLYFWPKLTYVPENHIWIYEPNLILIALIGVTIMLSYVGYLLKARKFCIGCLVVILSLLFYYPHTFGDGPYVKENRIVLDGKAYAWKDIRYSVLATSLSKGHVHVYFELHFSDGEKYDVGVGSTLNTDINGLSRVYHQLLKYKIPIQKEPLDEVTIKQIKFDFSTREQNTIFAMYQ